MIYLWIILGIMGYVFLATITWNILVLIDGKPNTTSEEEFYMCASILFPLTVVIGLLFLIGWFPFKLANFIMNPDNYKLRIKIERKEDEK